MPVPNDKLASPKEDRDQTNMNLTLSNLTSRHQKLTMDSIAGHLVLPKAAPISSPRKALWHHRLRSRCDKLSGQRR